MTTSSNPSPRSPLGHFLDPHWKQELDETQFARALLHVAAAVANDRAAEPAVPSDQNGDAA
jgi:hypothetical protein